MSDRWSSETNQDKTFPHLLMGNKGLKENSLRLEIDHFTEVIYKNTF